MFGGPLGMIAGIAFGHMFDKADDISGQIPYQQSQRTAYTTLDRSRCSSLSGLFPCLQELQLPMVQFQHMNVKKLWSLSEETFV